MEHQARVSASASDSEARLLGLIDTLIGELRAGSPVRATLDSALDRDLGLDSLARVELLARVEKRFDVRLPEETLQTAETPRALLAALRAAAPAVVGREAGEARLERPERAEGLPDEAGDLVEVLRWHAARHPDRVHVSFYAEADRMETLTAAELLASAGAAAAALAALGVGPGNKVALMLPSGLDFFRCFFGVLLAGAVPVPMYPPARPTQIEDHLRRQAGILRNCEAPVLVTFEQVRPLARVLTGLVPGLKHLVTPTGLAAEAERAGPASVPALQGSDVALIQYTSGSTGDPKGVVLAHANLLANIRAFGKTLEVGSTDVCVSWLPLYHDMGLIGTWLGALYHACPLILMSPLDFLARPERWLWAIHRHRGTISAAPNFAFELCLRRLGEKDLSGLDLSSWRTAMNGAEPVSPRTMGRFAETFSRYGLRSDALLPVYGLAECSLALCIPPPGHGVVVDRVGRDDFTGGRHARPAEPEEREVLEFVSCGPPLAGHRLRILGEEGEELPERRVGRLQFRGPSTTSGYYRNPEATRGLLQDGWLDSGDYAYMADGELYVTGRAKDMIIRGGRNFYPYELEQAVGELPGVRRGCVAAFASQDPASGTERLVVVAETRERDAAARQALEGRITALAADMLGLPPDVVVLAPPHAVLKTSSGKIRRAAVRERFERGELGASGRAPWRQVLRLYWAGAGGWARKGRAAVAHVLWGAWVWSALAVLAVLAFVAVTVLPTLEARWASARGLARLFARLAGCPLAVEGLGNIPGGPSVLVANHASYIDGLALAAALPQPVRFIGKAELKANAPIRFFLGRIGARFVERHDSRKSVEDARTLAADATRGPPLFFFAEGTFTRQPGLRDFRLGAFQVAAQADVPVVPVALAGTREVLREGTWLPVPGPITVTVSPPVPPEGEGWRGVLMLRDRVRGAILAHCQEPALESR